MLAMATYPLYVNCYQPMMLPQQPPQYSPYHDPSSYYQTRTPPMPIIGVSPASSGRFDAGYDSDVSGRGSFSDCRSPTEAAVVGAVPVPTPMYFHSPVPAAVPPPSPSPASAAVASAAWRDKFVANFSRFPIGSWHLKVVSEPPDLHNTGFARHLWRYHLDKARVNFLCTACHSSTTATGQAVFWIYKDDSTNTGYIHLKLYGQKCRQCQSPAEAMWHPREAGLALDGLFNHVAQAYYGIAAPAAAVESRSRNRCPAAAAAAAGQPATKLPSC